jgi:hypothetical protein
MGSLRSRTAFRSTGRWLLCGIDGISRSAIHSTGHWLSCGIDKFTAFPQCFSSLDRSLLVMRNYWNHCVPAMQFTLEVTDCHAELMEHCVPALLFARQDVVCHAELRESLRSRSAVHSTSHWLSCGIDGITAFPQCFSLDRSLIAMRNWWNNCVPAMQFTIQDIDCHAELIVYLSFRNAFRLTGHCLSCGFTGITALPHCNSLYRSLIVMRNCWNHCVPAMLFVWPVIDCHAELLESLRSRSAIHFTDYWLLFGFHGITAFPRCFSHDMSLIVMRN